MECDALLRRVSRTVDAPSLDDTASDWARVEHVLRPHFDDRPLEPTLTALRELGPALRRGGWQILATLADVGDGWRGVRAEPASETTRTLGLSIDLGTTTVVAELIDVQTGAPPVSRMVYNAQRVFGADVTSRMMHAEKPNGLDALRQTALDSARRALVARRVAARPQDRIVHHLPGIDR